MNINVYAAHQWSGDKFHLVGDDGKEYGYICSSPEWDEKTINCAHYHMKQLHGIDKVTFHLV